MTQQPNPLALGQTLYEILDATVIATPTGATAAQYNRVCVNSAGATAKDSLNLGAYGDIIDARAVSDVAGSTSSVYVLSRSALQVITGTGASLTQKSWPLSVGGLGGIVDADPLQPGKQIVWLLGHDTQVFLQAFDCAAGTAGARVNLSAVTGVPTRAILARRQLSAHVIVCCTSSAGALVVYDLGATVLGATPVVPATAPNISLGTLSAGSSVELSAASFVAGGDQQIAVAYTDNTGAPQLAILGWDANAKFTTLATVALSTMTPAHGPAVTALVPDSTMLRLTSADFFQQGREQLVIGYPSTFHSVKGCGALLLCELNPGTESGTYALSLLSTYAISAPPDSANDPQPFASIDFRIAAGIFGDLLSSDASGDPPSTPGVLGVLTIGCASTLAQLFSAKATIQSGMVTLDPVEKAFPSMGTVPGVPQQWLAISTVDANIPGILAFPSDITGQSVVLGPPVLSQTQGGRGQLLAMLQAPPYENSQTASVVPPSMSFGQGSTDVNGYNVSSNKMWMFSKDTGGTIGIGSLTLGRNVSNSYGHGFDQIDDSSTTNMLQVSNTISKEDMLVLYSVPYDVWVYPVYRSAQHSSPDGSLAVIFPQASGPIQTFLPASDASIGYLPRSQNGRLLSYLNLEPDGFDSTNPSLLFNLEQFSVTEDAGATVTYDQTKMVTQNISKSTSVHNSVQDSAHFSLSTTIFDYLPINFGLNISSGSSYSENDVQTTSVAHTTSLSIQIMSGQVADIGYEYQITPYIYQHETMGCLVVTYKVDLSGKDWAKLYATPNVMLISPYANSTDPVLAGFSRAISFAPQPDGTVLASVELFNNSLHSAQNASCVFYVGAPVLNQTKTTLQPPTGSPVGTQSLASIVPTGRGTVQLPMKLQAKDQVTVQVTCAGQATPIVYWGIYPTTEFSSWSEAVALARMMTVR